MLIGIKYCGGCNSGYDRVRFVEQLKERLPDIAFCSTEKNKRVDYLIVVCGCSKVCASTEGIYSEYGSIFIHSLNETEDVVRAISEAAEKHQKEKDKKRRIKIGDRVRDKRTMTEASVVLFTTLCEDYNKIYTDNDFAKKAAIPRRLIPSRLVSDYISGTMGTVFPGDGTLLTEEKTIYHEHVFIGDTLFSEITFVSFEEKEDVFLGTFKVLCINDKNQPVLEYEAIRKMPKQLFEPVK